MSHKILSSHLQSRIREGPPHTARHHDWRKLVARTFSVGLVGALTIHWTASAGSGSKVNEGQELVTRTTTQLTFKRDLEPILKKSCVKCHSGSRPSGRYRLSSRNSTVKGGVSGTAVVPGRSEESLLVQVVSDELPGSEMPPTRQRKRYPKLTPDQIDLLKQWIDQGAR
jgi:hypothetical protein